MSWKCGICDSYNEDISTQCYVCGQQKTSIEESDLMSTKPAEEGQRRTHVADSLKDTTAFSKQKESRKTPIVIEKKKREVLRDKVLHKKLDLYKVSGWIGMLFLTLLILFAVNELVINSPKRSSGILICFVLLIWLGIPCHFLRMAYLKSWKTYAWIWFVLAIALLMILLMI